MRPMYFPVVFLAILFTAHGATIQVPQDYLNIQDAIQAAQNGDTIEVAAGTYNEYLLVTKSISLIGEDRETTEINAQGLNTVITVLADQVTISGFTICNSAQLWPHSGLLLNYTSDHTITDNIFSNNWIAIHISDTSQVNISNNLFNFAYSHTIGSYAWSGFCSDIHISNNEFKGSNDGIFLHNTQDSTISDNLIMMESLTNALPIAGEVVDNLSIIGNEFVQTGAIKIIDGSNITVSGNDLRSDTTGCIDFESSNQIVISDNRISFGRYGVKVWGSSSHACQITGNTINDTTFESVYLYGDDSHISNNTIINSSHEGLILCGDTNEVYDNIIISCDGAGIKLTGSSNKIYHNNFVSNSPNADFMTGWYNEWDDGYPSGGNYWDDYQGVDNNGDGIGDTAYIIDGNAEDRYPLMTSTQPLPLKVMNVDTAKVFYNIQDAIDDLYTLDGHTISVPAGTYYEEVIVHKAIHLLGENASTTIIDGALTTNCVVIQSPNSTLQNFTIRNPVGPERKAVMVYTDNNIIDGNIIENCNRGIELDHAAKNIISNNKVKFSFIAIDIFWSNDNTIIGNQVTEADSSGIMINGSDNNTICSNEIMKVDFDSGEGIQLYDACHNTITGNHIEEGRRGIQGSWVEDNVVCGNTVININEFGLYFFRSHNNLIQSNVFRDITDIGVWIRIESKGNCVWHNQFINITGVNIEVDDTSFGHAFDAGYPMGGNYYDDLSGPDLFSGPDQDKPGSDGIIDVPYPILENHRDSYPLVNPHGGLTIDAQSIIASTGGTVNFVLNERMEYAYRNYVILGSASGIFPGTPIPGIYANTLPLNWDGFTNLMIPALNTPVFNNFLGQLDGTGTANADLNSSGSVPPDAVGITLNFAYALYDLFDIVSNPVSIVILP